MPLFPVHRPQIGLSFSGQSLGLVELRRRWRPGWHGTHLHRVCEQPVPANLVRPSQTVPNVSDVTSLAQEVRALVGSTGTVAAAVSLPDQCAQIGLFEFDTLPKQAADREALLRWRFREELNVPPGDSHLAYRPFRGLSKPLPSGEQSAAPHLVLAVNIRRDILRQYEEVCEAAGLLPVAVGLSTLQLFDLCRTLVPRAEELFFAHCTQSVFAFLALHHGCPVFFRLKPLGHAPINLADELIGTLQFYDEQAPHVDLPPETPPRRLFLLGTETLAAAGAGESMNSPMEGSCVRPTRHRNWRIDVVRLGWADLPISGKNLGGCPFSGLLAFAGAIAG